MYFGFWEPTLNVVTLSTTDKPPSSFNRDTSSCSFLEFSSFDASSSSGSCLISSEGGELLELANDETVEGGTDDEKEGAAIMLEG